MCTKYKNWTDLQVEQVKNHIIPDGKNYAQCMYFCRTRLGMKFSLPKKSKIPDIEKHRAYAEMYASGMTYAEIAKKVGLSRQRVGVIVKNWKNHDGLEEST